MLISIAVDQVIICIVNTNGILTERWKKTIENQLIHILLKVITRVIHVGYHK
ncbi:hypothetical protein D3C73_800120 [compost metagenome]